MGDRRAAAPRMLAGAVVAGGLAVSAIAAPPAPRAAPVWTADKAASRLSFRAVVAGKPFDGVFKRWDAQLAFDPADLAASRLQVTVETGSAVTGDPARDALLPSPAWLGASRFPRATFASRAFTPEGPGRYRISGVATVRGVSRPLDAHVQVTPAGDRLMLTGGFPLDRHAFGIGPASDTDAAETVQVQARLAARRAK